MVLILCLVLAACHSSSGRYVYDIIPLDNARQDDLEDDFDRALKYFSGLDPSKDGYYFVYQRDVEFDEPGVCLFFYDKGDSITICQSRKKRVVEDTTLSQWISVWMVLKMLCLYSPKRR